MASFHHCIKSGKKGSAAQHGRYIDRQGYFESREDLLYRSFGNLPTWAEGDPASFWRMADKHERANGAAYREHEIALPNELGNQQLIDLAERIVLEVVGDKPYQYAIHVGDGSLGGILNPHVHVMYSDRVDDGIPRPPELTFARYNRKQPESGGRRKDSGGKAPLELRDEVIRTRKKIAELQNAALAQRGFSTRVDHRSHRERGIALTPERHLGAARIKHMPAAAKAQYVTVRSEALETPAHL